MAPRNKAALTEDCVNGGFLLQDRILRGETTAARDKPPQRGRNGKRPKITTASPWRPAIFVEQRYGTQTAAGGQPGNIRDLQLPSRSKNVTEKNRKVIRYQRKTSRRRPDQMSRTKKSRRRSRRNSPERKIAKALNSLRTRGTQIDLKLTSANSSVPCDAETYEGRLSRASGLRG